MANAAAAGIIVVAASGNAGPTPYITSAPAVYEGAISVAATDALAGIPLGNMALSTGPTLSVERQRRPVSEPAEPTGGRAAQRRRQRVAGLQPQRVPRPSTGGVDSPARSSSRCAAPAPARSGPARRSISAPPPRR